MSNPYKTSVDKFVSQLKEHGDMFFSTGDVYDDYHLIQIRISVQGYWSGVRNRYYFDNDLNLIDIESRF